MKIFNSVLIILNHPNNNNNKINTILRLIWWKLNQLFFKFPAIIELTSGVKCICYPNSSFGSLIVYTQLPEYLEMTFLKRYLSDDSVFIDVGAGIGDFSLIAASKINKGRIFSFEPVKESYNRFIENIRINGFDNKIELIKKVISDKNGYISFSEEKVNEISHINLDQKNKNKRKTLSLDSFLLKNNLPVVDLIKIDVEGAESMVLSGLSKSFKKNKIKLMIIELNNNSSAFGTNSQNNYLTIVNNKFKCFKVDQYMLTSISSSSEISNKRTENIICIHRSLINTSKIKKLLNDFKN
jgi:FkbM family methyltransferase